MPIENKIRSVGHKTVVYPWFRKYIVVGPYNRHVRRDIATNMFERAFAVAFTRAGSVTTRASNAVSSARSRRGKPDHPAG
jgi:hypothetical protein